MVRHQAEREQVDGRLTKRPRQNAQLGQVFTEVTAQQLTVNRSIDDVERCVGEVESWSIRHGFLVTRGVVRDAVIHVSCRSRLLLAHRRNSDALDACRGDDRKDHRKRHPIQHRKPDRLADREAIRSGGRRWGRGSTLCGRGRRRRPGRSRRRRRTPGRSRSRLTSVVQPARRPMIHDSTTPATTPTRPPAHEISVASSRNWRTIARRGAPTARRTPISRVRSRTLASMMFMMPMPPTSSEIEAIATITSSKMRCVRRCSASSSDGTTMREVVGAVVRLAEQPADHARRRHGRVRRRHLQVDAVDLVLALALAVLEAQDRRAQRHVDHVVAILGRRAVGAAAAPTAPPPQTPTTLQPLLVDLDVLAERRPPAEQRDARPFAQHRDRRRGGVVRGGEEAPLGDLQAGDALERRLDAEHGRRARRTAWDQLRRREPLARAWTRRRRRRWLR